jgi:hypothetical protein
MNIQDSVINRILYLLEEKGYYNMNEKIDYLYVNTYLEEKRLKNILNKKAKKITIKEIDAIAYALGMSIKELFENL